MIEDKAAGEVRWCVLVELPDSDVAQARAIADAVQAAINVGPSTR